jgi:hypothetical protein
MCRSIQTHYKHNTPKFVDKHNVVMYTKNNNKLKQIYISKNQKIMPKSIKHKSKNNKLAKH